MYNDTSSILLIVKDKEIMFLNSKDVRFSQFLSMVSMLQIIQIIDIGVERLSKSLILGQSFFL